MTNNFQKKKGKISNTDPRNSENPKRDIQYLAHHSQTAQKTNIKRGSWRQQKKKYVI